MAMLPGTKTLTGKNLCAQIRNPGSFVDGAGGSGTFVDFHTDEVKWTTKVDEAMYSSNALSGYQGRTGGLYGAEGSFNILLDLTNPVMAGAAGTPPTGIGVQMDDFIDLQVYATNARANAAFAGLVHIISLDKGVATADNKLKIAVKFATHGKWVEN